MRSLHVAAEVFPLIKTGGLADVAAALPLALQQAGTEARLLLPGYPAILDGVQGLKEVCFLGGAFGTARMSLKLGAMPDTGLPIYVLDAPYLYRRAASPYQDAGGADWPDNLQRFAALGWAGAQLAGGDFDAHWRPDVVHAHDWHAAMACAYVSAHPPTASATVFTIHNLAYQGLFPLNDFHLLALPSRYQSTEGLEFHGQLSFMKAGVQFADRVTTVSPSYAREIATPAFGCRMEGLIQSRGSDVCGILNGIDTRVWNPESDPLLPARFGPERLEGKAACKQALQAELALDARPEATLFAVVSRLTEQKGLDLVLQTLPVILEAGAQLVVQGVGDAWLEAAFAKAAQDQPGRVAMIQAYDEQRAHRVIAGADALLMPSRFEPCGLTQLYALRYGTLPVVHNVGGLADTVKGVTERSLADASATGFVFDRPDPGALAAALQTAAALRAAPERWRQVVLQAMSKDHSWSASASCYLDIYDKALQSRANQPRRVLPAPM